MSIQLTEAQHQAITQSGETPPRMLDPVTRTQYVLVREDVFARMQTLLAEDDVRLMEPLLAELAPEDWEDAANYDNKP